jgi:hypothetical protein
LDDRVLDRDRNDWNHRPSQDNAVRCALWLSSTQRSAHPYSGRERLAARGRVHTSVSQCSGMSPRASSARAGVKSSTDRCIVVRRPALSSPLQKRRERRRRCMLSWYA